MRSCISQTEKRRPLPSVLRFPAGAGLGSAGSFICAGVVAPDPPYRAAVIRTGQFPGVRLSSGLTIYDEELRNGRLLTRYWGSNGQIVPDAYLDGDRWQIDMLPADTFKLEIEKQELSGTWKWIGAEKSEVSQSGRIVGDHGVGKHSAADPSKGVHALERRPRHGALAGSDEQRIASDCNFERISMGRATLAHSELRGKTSA